MVSVELKGIHRVRSKGKTYHYAWRGGPSLPGEPGSPEFMDAYNAAIADRATPDASLVRGLVAQYKASRDYQKLAATTHENWGRWLDRISDHFGKLRVVQFDRPQKIRPVIRKWRSTYADTPRAADYGMQVLSRVLAFAVEQGRLAGNPCEGIRQLYSGSRAEIIWTDDDIAQLKAARTDTGRQACSTEVAHAVDLASHTGLRVSDLIRLSWSHVQGDVIVISTGKSRHRRDAVIPIYGDLRAVLDSIPKRATTILTSSIGTPWTRDGLGSSFNKAKIAAGLAERDLHFHDLRGTAATKFYTAGLSERVIAEIMAWEEDQVARIIRRYVSRAAATKAVIRQLDRAKRRT